MNRALRRLGRSVVQVLASGALTVGVNALVGGMTGSVKIWVAFGFFCANVFAQNYMEQTGRVSMFLPDPSPSTGSAPLVQPK